jgi:hypothetical protein
MSGIRTEATVKEQSISAFVTRADGTVENLGVISYYHRNPVKRLLGQLRVWLNNFKRR